MPSFFDAIHDGDLEAVRKQLVADAELANTPVGDTTPLLRACTAKQTVIAELLLSFGADPNEADDDGETPLHVAAFDGSEALVEMLVKAGADIECATSEGKTVLMNAAQSGSMPTVRLLLDAGADPLARDELDRTALHWASVGSHDDSEIVGALLAAGAVHDAENAHGATPMNYALAMRKIAIAAVLRDHARGPGA